MTTCIATSALLNDLRFRALTPTFRAAVLVISARLEEFGDGSYSDEVLRIEVKLGPVRWKIFDEVIHEYEWFADDERGNLCRAGILAPSQPLEQPAINKDALRARDSHLLDKVKGMFDELRAELGLSATEKTEDTAPEVRRNGHAKPKKTAPKCEDNTPETRTEGEDAVGSDPPINSINLINSEPMVQIKLINDPVTDQRDRLRAMLLQIGLTPKEVSQAFEVHDLEHIAQGIECQKRGFWSNDYPKDVSMRNYLFKDFKLSFKYQNKISNRKQTALELLVTQPGGQAAQAVVVRKRTEEEKAADAELERVNLEAMNKAHREAVEAARAHTAAVPEIGIRKAAL